MSGLQCLMDPPLRASKKGMTQCEGNFAILSLRASKPFGTGRIPVQSLCLLACPSPLRILVGRRFSMRDDLPHDESGVDGGCRQRPAHGKRQALA